MIAFWVFFIVQGYAEAKKIELIFGKDVKVYKALIQELKSLKHYKY